MELSSRLIGICPSCGYPIYRKDAKGYSADGTCFHYSCLIDGEIHKE